MIFLLLLLQALISVESGGYQYYVCNMYADDIDNLDEDDTNGHHGGHHWWFGHWWGNNHHIDEGDNTDGYVIVRPISTGGFLVPPQSTGTGTYYIYLSFYKQSFVYTIHTTTPYTFRMNLTHL